MLVILVYVDLFVEETKKPLNFQAFQHGVTVGPCQITVKLVTYGHRAKAWLDPLGLKRYSMFGRLGIRDIANVIPRSPQGRNLIANSLVSHTRGNR